MPELVYPDKLHYHVLLVSLPISIINVKIIKNG